MFIESPQNKIVKHAASLKEKKFRDEHGQFLAEGLRSVVDIIKAAPGSVLNIFVSHNQADRLVAELRKLSFEKNMHGTGREAEGAQVENTETGKNAVGFHGQEWCGDVDYLVKRLIELPENLMKKLSDTATPQDIIAVAKQKQESKVGNYCVYLDRIRDPGNLGTIIRTAAAAGYSLVLDGCADIFSPKVVRSSMSAIMSVDFCYAERCGISALKNNGYTLLAADMDGKSMYGFSREEKICIVIGNEAGGVSPQILQCCDKVVSIPVNGVESLNAAVSAAILMYHFKYGIN